jgi:hypothetical protein
LSITEVRGARSVIETDADDPGVTDIRSEELVATEEAGGECRARQLHVEDRIALKLILGLDNSIIHRVGDNLFFVCLLCLRVFVLLLRVWLGLDLALQLLGLVDAIL